MGFARSQNAVRFRRSANTFRFRVDHKHVAGLRSSNYCRAGVPHLGQRTAAFMSLSLHTWHRLPNLNGSECLLGSGPCAVGERLDATAFKMKNSNATIKKRKKSNISFPFRRFGIPAATRAGIAHAALDMSLISRLIYSTIVRGLESYKMLRCHV